MGKTRARRQPIITPRTPEAPWGDRLLPDDFQITFQKVDRRCDRADCISHGAWIDLDKKCVAYGRHTVNGRVTTPARAAEHLWEVDSHVGWAIVTWCLSQTHGRTPLMRFAHALLCSIHKDETFFQYSRSFSRLPVRDEWNIPSGNYHHMSRDFLPEEAEYPEQHQDIIKYLSDDNTPPRALWEIFRKDLTWVRDHVSKRFAVAAICGCGSFFSDDIIFRLQYWRPISYEEIINFNPKARTP